MTYSKIAVIPAYEPEAVIIRLAKKLCENGYTVIVVDDGSGERFQEIFGIVSEYATVLTHETNKGKGCALKTALQYIKDSNMPHGIIVTLDADGQHTIEDTVMITEEAAKHPDSLTIGGRKFEGKVPLRSRFGNSMTRLVYTIFTGIKVHDTQTGLRAFGCGLIPFMLDCSGERYEYEMNVLLECSRNHIKIYEKKITTIYQNNNSGSHFNAFRDSFRIYSIILKFAASSFVGFLVDYLAYSILMIALSGLGSAVCIPVSNITARIFSSTVNFSINKKLVFKNNDSLIKTAVQYFTLAVLILIGNTLFLSLLVHTFGMNSFLAKIFTEIVFFGISWTVQRFLIFPRTTDQ